MIYTPGGHHLSTHAIMDHIQIMVRVLLIVLMKSRMHMLPIYRAILLHTYKPPTYDEPHVAQ